MSAPRVVAIADASPAAVAGLRVDDVVIAINGEAPRDVIRWQLMVDGPDPVLDIERGGLGLTVEVDKPDGAALGLEVHSAVFDQVRTCDNHCAFCFIYQLPKGMRKSLYLKDDDFRLSFLYGNFTTLTRFTEADLERVLTEGLTPLYVSIHATDPDVRSDMLRNRRGGTSLRWLRALLDHGVEVHGQLVVCPGVNDADVLADTMVGILDEYPELASVAVVPLGISDHSNEPTMRAHTTAEAEAVVDLVEAWQEIYLAELGHRLAFCADEYYLLAGRPFPTAEIYGEFNMHEDGIGMARTFESEFRNEVDTAIGVTAGFFASVDGAPAEGYRAPRLSGGSNPGGVLPDDDEAPAPRVVTTTGGGLLRIRPSVRAPVAVLTSTYGAMVLGPLLGELGRDDVRIIEVENRFFGGNIGVAGLMVGADLLRTLADEPEGHRYLLPDVCLSNGRFLDGLTPDDLPRPVEILPTDGHALRRALRPVDPDRTATA